MLPKAISEGQTATANFAYVEKYQKIAQKLEKQHKWQEAAIYYRKALELNIQELSSSLAFPQTKQKHQGLSKNDRHYTRCVHLQRNI